MKMEKLKNTVVDLTVFSSLVKEEAYHDWFALWHLSLSSDFEESNNSKSVYTQED
jgi:hypothetical protein